MTELALIWCLVHNVDLRQRLSINVMVVMNRIDALGRTRRTKIDYVLVLYEFEL